MKSDPSLRKILGQLENEEPMDVEVKMQPKKEVFFSGRVFFSLRFTQVFSLLPLVSWGTRQFTVYIYIIN